MPRDAARPYRRFVTALLAPLLLSGLSLPTGAQEVKRPTVQKPAAPTVKKPGSQASKPTANSSKPRRKAGAAAAAGAATTAAAATALAAGTQAPPSLPASADPDLRALEARARDGDGESQMALADALSSQTPTPPQDLRRALYWYGQAAAKGDADASWTLAELFRGDLGIPDDMEQAAGWYRKAAEMGHAEAAFDLGLLYAEGYGVVRDTTEAARWFEMAADAGLARALYMLGTLYEEGIDGAPDLMAARAWYARSAEAGDPVGRQALRRLEAGGRNVEVAAGPPPGMLGGPPGSATIRRSTHAGTLADSAEAGGEDEEDGDSPATPTASGSAAGARAIPVDQAGVREIQTRLIKLGFHKGKADGFLGKRTMAAIRAYQKSAGLPVDGKASQALLRKLRQG